VIAGAANEIAVMANAVTQMTQDLRLSTVGTGAVEAIVEETLVLADIIEVPQLVAKHPTRRRHRQGEPPRRADLVRSDYDWWTPVASARDAERTLWASAGRPDGDRHGSQAAVPMPTLGVRLGAIRHANSGEIG
jgi:hypothetical protein